MTVCWCLGWKIITAEKMPLHFILKWGEQKVKEGYKVFDGLIVCEWCVPNLHGLLFVWPAAFALGIIPFEWNYKYLLVYPFMVGAASFITGMLWNLYLVMNAKKDSDEWSSKYYDNAQKYYYNLNKEIKEKNGKSE